MAWGLGASMVCRCFLVADFKGSGLTQVYRGEA